jgi:hypothetical protein
MNLEPGYYTSEDGTRRYYDGENWVLQEKSETQVNKRRAWKPLVVVIGSAALLVGGYLVWSDLDYQSQLEKAFSSRSEAVSDFFPEIARICGVGTTSGFSVDEKRMSMDGKGAEDVRGASFEDIACALFATDIPDAVVSQIDNTSSLQGVREASWEVLDGDAEIFSKWSYHPDSGLNLSLELDSVYQDDYFKEDHERLVRSDTNSGLQRISEIFFGETGSLEVD